MDDQTSFLKLAKGARRQAAEEQAREREQLAATEATYRLILHRAFTLAALGPEPSSDECDQILDQLAALTDTIGVARAETIRCEEKAKWLTATGRCPYCGGPAHG